MILANEYHFSLAQPMYDVAIAWVAVDKSLSLLLMDDDDNQLFLPLVTR